MVIKKCCCCFLGFTELTSLDNNTASGALVQPRTAEGSEVTGMGAGWAEG